MLIHSASIDERQMSHRLANRIDSASGYQGESKDGHVKKWQRTCKESAKLAVRGRDCP